MKIANSSEMAWPDPQQSVATIRRGETRGKILANETTAENLNLLMVLVRFGKGERSFETPRHRHTFEQVRIAIEGDYNFGPRKAIPQGCVGFFPAGAFYGPQHVEDNIAATLQYGFGDDMIHAGPNNVARLAAAIAGMSERGEFRDGVYADVDPATGEKRNRDAVTAVYEDGLGRKLTLPEPPYSEPILIDPSQFAWRVDDSAPGLLVRDLGTFTDRLLGLRQLRWEESGAIWPLSRERAHLVLFTTDGLQVGEESYPALTCVYADRDEHERLGAARGTEAWLIELPTISAGLRLPPRVANACADRVA